MTSSRRQFIHTTAATAFVSSLAPPARPATASPVGHSLVKPARLQPGDVIGLVDPASATWEPVDIDIVVESVSALGFKAKRGARLLNRRGYFAGTDEERAADLNAMFGDPEVKAIQCVRGGWGSARLLPLLDWATIQRNPKVVLGFSDITALVLAIHAKTGLVTFHGPNGASQWNPFNVDYFRRVLTAGEAVTFANVKEIEEENLTVVENRVQTIRPGTARGRLLGGNLTVLTSIIGSGLLPEFDGCVLFIEDVDEAPYRIDRMLMQLRLTGILQRARAVIWGTCSKCEPDAGFGSLTITDVLNDHVKPLDVPAWQGAMIGHVDRQFTLPLGIEVEANATLGTIRMLEPAVM
jgi:muramoyltetrapeptide carboxypeptidase